jgi:hypothetical protein
MKKTFIVFMLFSFSVLYSQTDSIHKKSFKYLLVLKTKQDSIKPFIFSLNLNDNKDIFSVYNQSTKLNDVFIIKNDTTTLVKSIYNINNNYRNPKIDSFNPYGASDVKSGLIIGAIGGVFRSIFNTN